MKWNESNTWSLFLFLLYFFLCIFMHIFLSFSLSLPAIMLHDVREHIFTLWLCVTYDSSVFIYRFVQPEHISSNSFGTHTAVWCRHTIAVMQQEASHCYVYAFLWPNAKTQFDARMSDLWNMGLQSSFKRSSTTKSCSNRIVRCFFVGSSFSSK